MYRRLAVFLASIGLLTALSGCYRTEDTGYNALRAGSTTPSTGISSRAAVTGAADPAPKATAASVPRPAATVAKAREPDPFLLQQCINFNYAYPIVQAVAEGILAPAVETLLRQELEEYDRLNEASLPMASDVSQAESEPVELLGAETARELALPLIEKLFSPPVDLSAVEPTAVELRDYRQDPPRDWLGWETYYEVNFEVADPAEKGIRLFYSVNVDGRTGELVSGNFGRFGDGSPDELVPSDAQIQKMQERAKTFVLEKELVPGASVAYVCSSTWGGASSELQTEVYLSDGTVVDVHEGFEPGTRLYFNLFPTHGFAAPAGSNP